MSDETLQIVREMPVAHDAATRASSRDRKPTEKGIQYEIDTCEKDFKWAVSRWRNCVAKITVLLSDATDVGPVRDGRNQLENACTEVKDIFSRLNELYDPGNREIENITKIFEDLEQDY